MPLFAYQVLDKGGEVVTGKLEAESDLAAAARLVKLGYTPVEVNEIKTSLWARLFQFQRKAGIGELALFSRQLAAMLSAGIPLTRCLYVLGEQAATPVLGEALPAVARSVEGGMSFSQALRAYREIFSGIYVELVHAGEVGSTLETVLVKLSQQLESEKMLRDNMRAAMFYPFMVLAFAVLLMIAMLLFIVPVFVGFYPDGHELPFLTSFIIALSDSVRAYWYLYFLGGALFVTGLRAYMAGPGGHVYDRLKFRIPVFGPLVQKIVIARFARTLSALLAGGIPVLQALETAGPAAGSSLVLEAARYARERIREGQSIARPLKESGLFPPMVTLMISVGEETGDVPGLLNRVAEFYEQEVAALSKGLTSLIEPVMIIGVGGIIAVIVIALYLPMFSVIATYQH
ncbi:MAG: type II secretion system F family protein [Firmicutes bacterium]|nr:type II secretion system F family protein [Bacillota bacterium]